MDQSMKKLFLMPYNGFDWLKMKNGQNVLMEMTRGAKKDENDVINWGKHDFHIYFLSHFENRDPSCEFRCSDWLIGSF
jgi:hypothetical protein